MADALRITLFINLTLLLIGIILIFIYLTPIILVRRFHTAGNILTGNVCLASIACSLFWIIFNVIYGFYPTLLTQSTFSYIFSVYFQTMFNCLLIYSLAIITINRFLTIKYSNKRFFKRRAWPIISSIVQWIVGIILPLPLLVFCLQDCIYVLKAPFSIRFYAFFITVLLPSIVNVVFNSLIYFSVRSSTRRVLALASTTSATAATTKHQNARDIYLLKHIFFIFVVFVLGWTPNYILPTINLDEETALWLLRFIQFLPVISSIIIVLDLFIYNHDLRRYLQEKLLKLFD